MPRIIKNDTDSYIMKNGVAYGDGLTGYVIKNGVYFGYMSNPRSLDQDTLLWKGLWDREISDEYVQKTLTHALSNYNMLHIRIFNNLSDISMYLTPVHMIISRDIFDSTSSNNPIVCTFQLNGAGVFRSVYIYKVSDTSIAVRREGDTIGSDITVRLSGETV